MFTELDPCASAPCNAGGVCSPSATGTSFTCNCPAGTFGPTCGKVFFQILSTWKLSIHETFWKLAFAWLVEKLFALCKPCLICCTEISNVFPLYHLCVLCSCSESLPFNYACIQMCCADPDPCATNPCVTGTCTPGGPGGFTCACPQGKTGDTCSEYYQNAFSTSEGIQRKPNR